MSDYERVSGKLRKIDLTEYDDDVEVWARNYLILIDQLSQAEENSKEYGGTLTEYVRYYHGSKFFFLREHPYEIISKVDHRYPTEFSEVKENGDGTFDFHCCWYNGGASLEEVVESGFDNMSKEDK